MKISAVFPFIRTKNPGRLSAARMLFKWKALPAFWKLALTKALRLRLNQFCIVKVVQLHCVAHFMQSLRRYSAGIFAALTQNLIDIRNVLLELTAAGPNGLQFLLKNGIQELFYLHIAQAAAAIVIFQLI